MRRLVMMAAAGIVLGGCSAPLEGVLDLCDGLDDDGDGLVDEDVGEAAGCEWREICVAGQCAPNCGDGYCGGRESCGSCAADCGACPTCGDGACNAAESCGDCAADCGACPGCGDGNCSEAESCRDCAADCGACPGCGDGTCSGTETCGSCGEDCGLCPGECDPCGPGFTCGAGFECLLRYCDGAAGCYGDSPLGCAEIGGLVCPPVSAWDRCTTEADCGRLHCISGRCQETYAIGPSRAATEACWSDTFWCPPAPDTPAGLGVDCLFTGLCSEEGCSFSCAMTCTDSCPYGMTCMGGTCGGADV